MAVCFSFHSKDLGDLGSCPIERGGKNFEECGLSPDTSDDLPYNLSDSIPTYDELCRQFIGYV